MNVNIRYFKRLKTLQKVVMLMNHEDVLPPNLAKSRSREIVCDNDRIVLKFDRHLGSIAAEMVVKFQSD